MGPARCSRDARCDKGKGHMGWCRTNAPRTGSGRRAGGQAAARIAAMAELGAKRGMSRAERRLAREQGEGEEEEEEESEEEEVDAAGSAAGDESAGEAGEEETAVAPAPRQEKKSPVKRKARVRRGEPAEESDGEGETPPEPATDPDPDPPDLHPLAIAGLGGIPIPMFEAIRVPRAKLEVWAHEPFLERLVLGALVRVTVGQPGGGLYRAALVCGVDETETAYALGTRRTSKRLRLDFGEATITYPMAVVSNGAFEPLELYAYDQVLQATGRAPFTRDQMERKAAALKKAVGTGYQYSEQEVQQMVQRQVQAHAAGGTGAPLTARQKLLARSGGAGASDEVVRPKKMARDRFGNAVVKERGVKEEEL